VLLNGGSKLFEKIAFVLGRVVGFLKCSHDSIRKASRLPKHFEKCKRSIP